MPGRAPSVTVPHRSASSALCPCGHAAYFRRRASSFVRGVWCRRDTSARAAPGVRVGQPAPKAASKVSHKTRRSSEELRGVARIASVPLTNRHDSSWFESFRYHFALFWSFWRAISEPGWTSEKKSQLESGLNRRSRAKAAASYIKSIVETSEIFHCLGCISPRTSARPCHGQRGSISKRTGVAQG